MRRTKTSSGRTKRPNQMTKEELIATLLKKKQCNAQALSIVEQLLEVSIDPKWLLDSLNFISQSHYQDAVEERAIIKICGYPLCSNPLGNIPTQQFHISVRNNKVYDIFERKNFCSNACYRSSSYLKNQILTSPLWLRDIEKVPQYKLLQGDNIVGSSGDAVDFALSRVTLQDAFGSAGSSAHADNQSQEDIDKQCPASESTESTPNISRNNKNFEEKSPVVFHSEPDLSIIEEKKLSSNTHDKMEALPDGNSRFLEKSEEVSMRIGLDEETIPKNICVEPCSDIGTSEASNGTNISKIGVEVMENNVEKQEMVSENTACDSDGPKSPVMLADVIGNNVGEQEMVSKNTACNSDGPKSPVVLADVIKDQRSPRLAVNSCEKSKETHNDKETRKRDNHTAKVRKEKRTSRHVKVCPVALACLSELVEERLKEWFTIDSLCFLYGEQRVRAMLEQLGGDLEQNFKPLDSATWDPEKYERFVNICKRLNLQDLEDKTYDEEVISEHKTAEKKPLPDFNKLKEEAERMDLRVKAFYNGQLELEPKKVTFAEGTKDTEEKECPVIPLVHQHEQRALRRRLVLNALNRVLPDLLRTLGVNPSQVNSSLRGLVGTFALTAGNITFNPRQWTLVAIVIIKLLSIREPRLEHALASEASKKYLTLIQMSYNLSPSFLNLLITQLVSIVPAKPDCIKKP